MQNLENYNYILCFDLSKHRTGFALIDSQKEEVVWFGSYTSKGDNIEDLQSFDDIIGMARQEIGPNEQLLILKEACPLGYGGSTTIKTIAELYRMHLLLDIIVEQNKLDIEDISAISVRAWFKRTYNIEKPSKQDINELVCGKYGLDLADKFDETDAVACWMTYKNFSYEQRLKLQIAEVRKELKTAKTKPHIETLQARWTALNNQLDSWRRHDQTN